MIPTLKRSLCSPCSILNMPERKELLIMNVKGIHHLSAMTGNAPGNFDFYTKVLGMRLVIKL
jgi:hypothetical protein